MNDTVQAKLWFLNNPKKTEYITLEQALVIPIINWAMYNYWFEQLKIKPQKNYIDFPKNLQGSYQDYTKADLSSLREVGFRHQFLDLQSGINLYLDYLNSLNA